MLEQHNNTFEYSYSLSCEKDENNLVVFLKRMSEPQWLKYKFENLDDQEDLKKVVFRMILKAACSESDIYWKFAWEKITRLELAEYILREANYEVIKCTLMNFKKHQSLIMRKANQYLEGDDYSKMLKTIFKHIVYCHNRLLYGVVYNNANCLNFLWGYVANEEKIEILKFLGNPNVQKLLGILSVQCHLEDKTLLKFLKRKYNFRIEPEDNFFLSDKKHEAALSEFLYSCGKKESLKKLDLLWSKKLASLTEEDRRKALLRLFLVDATSIRHEVSDWAWKKSLEVEEQVFIFQGADYYVIKHIVLACYRSTLHHFLSKASTYLTKTEHFEMVKEAVEHIVHWHGKMYDEAVVNNTESLKNLLSKLGKPLTEHVLKSLNETVGWKLNLMLKSEISQEESEPWFAQYILTNATVENDLTKLLHSLENREQITEKSLNKDWNSHGLQHLSFQNLYSANFRAFIFSIGSTNVDTCNWVWKRVEELKCEIKILKEQNYHFIKTVMDLSNVDLLNRTIKIAVNYLDEDEMHCMYREAYIHAVKSHGKFTNGHVWNSTSSLETLKKVCNSHQWRNIFKFIDEKEDVIAKRGTDESTENYDKVKKVKIEIKKCVV